MWCLHLQWQTNIPLLGSDHWFTQRSGKQVQRHSSFLNWLSKANTGSVTQCMWAHTHLKSRTGRTNSSETRCLSDEIEDGSKWSKKDQFYALHVLNKKRWNDQQKQKRLCDILSLSFLSFHCTLSTEVANPAELDKNDKRPAHFPRCRVTSVLKLQFLFFLISALYSLPWIQKGHLTSQRF